MPKRILPLAILLLLSLKPLTSLSAVTAPEPNAKVPLYLMGPPTPERMRIALISEVVEVEGEHEELIRAGVKVIFYDWLFAKYGEEMNSSYLISFQGPYGKAMAYDYGSERVRKWRAKELVDRMIRERYDGVFFDWFPNACDPELAEEVAPGYVKEFKRRHPDLTLKKALLKFIEELRKEGRKRGIEVLIISNQAYRCDPDVMAAVDWDISESYFTTVEQGRTHFMPWEQSWDSPAFYVPILVSNKLEEARKINFRLKFTHLSYALPGDREAAFYSFAGAMIFGHDGIAQTPFEIGSVVTYPPPNSYWLGCLREVVNSSYWAMAAYDLGIVAAGQVKFESPYHWLVYDLKEGIVKRLGLEGKDRPWGSVYLRVPEKVAHISCLNKSLPVWDDMLTEPLLETLNSSCRVKVEKTARGLEAWSSWREPSKEVLIVANEIDWELSGELLADRLRKEGIIVERAPLNVTGLFMLLDAKAVVILGGPRSPILGKLLKPLLSKAGDKAIIGPGRLLLWIWGRDRFETREETLRRTEDVVRQVKKVLVRPCKW